MRDSGNVNDAVPILTLTVVNLQRFQHQGRYMLPRRAKIVLCACVAACAGVWWNAMHLQHGTRADILARTQRLGETFRRPPAPGPIEAAQPRLAPEIPDAPAIISDADLDVDVVRAVQRELAHRGYEPGAADGLVHPVTRAAV